MNSFARKCLQMNVTEIDNMKCDVHDNYNRDNWFDRVWQ